MKITKDGFYNLRSVKESKIYIEDGIKAVFFDDQGVVQHIELGNHAELEYFSFFSGAEPYKKHIVLPSEGSKCGVHSLLFSEENIVDAKIIGELSASGTYADMNILSFAGQNGNIKIDGVLKINKSIQKVGGFLNEENIFLGESGRISGFPTLFVETNDMNASHACNIEKISDERLFYLRTKGIPKKNALSMMIEAKIVALFQKLECSDVQFYEALMKKVLGMVQ